MSSGFTGRQAYLRVVIGTWIALDIGLGPPRAGGFQEAERRVRPAWSGRGDHRLLVRVGPVDLGSRSMDEAVAVFTVDFAGLLSEGEAAGQVDLSTLQVHKYDPATGAAEPFPAFAQAASPCDRPCRFDDMSVPEDYPGRVGRASEQPTGRPPITIRKGKGRLFNREQDNTSGRLVWVHTQVADQPSHYAIYFRVRPITERSGPTAAPWIGDVDVLRRAEGESLSGFAHWSMSTGDVNGDGLFDLLGGTEKGDLIWFPNRGVRGKPEFTGCRMLRDEEGPIDVGWYGSPYLYDWDADGLPDLVVGTSGNVILWWKNLGPAKDPVFGYRGFVQADGGRLQVPESPVPEAIGKTFERDYYNQPWVGDWNGDGLPDILTGGYTTGLIFHYEGTGRDDAGVPQLRFAGTLEADGKPIDTTWAAAPFAYDFDRDGLLELVTGSWWYSGIRREPEPGEIEFLMYYENNGTRQDASLRRHPLPSQGSFPRGAIARPSAADWDDDGLPDLLVSDNAGDTYVFRNVGKEDAPRWDLASSSLTVPWGFVRGAGVAVGMVDADGDGRLEGASGGAAFGIEGSPYAPRAVRRGLLQSGGRPIRHPGPGYGDPYAYTALCDWNGDGRCDLLWGTQQGNIYLHSGREGGEPFDFQEGQRLRLTSGDDLKVGPPVVPRDQATDFTTLQGSRILFVTGDFDGDGILDLCVAETYGNLWIFRNTKAGGADTLEPGVRVARMPSRTSSLSTLDWNRDGKPDLLTSGTAAEPGVVYVNTSEAGRLAVADPIRPFALPYVFWGPCPRAVDWNRDGDEDLLIESEFFSFLAERSFLESGYRAATALGGLEGKADAVPGKGADR